MNKKGFMAWFLGLFNGIKAIFTIDDAEQFQASLPEGLSDADRVAYVSGAVQLLRVKGIANVVAETAAEKISQKNALADDRERDKDKVRAEADERIAELNKQIRMIKSEADEKTMDLLDEIENYLNERDAAAQAKELFGLAA